MAPASLFSVELEFLAMADQADCILVGVASIGTPVLHSTVPFHRSTPPNSHSQSHMSYETKPKSCIAYRIKFTDYIESILTCEP